MSQQPSGDATLTTVVGIEQWDLTNEISPYLDRHMMFPLLEYLDSLIRDGKIKSYQAKDVAEARLALLRPTHMIDYMIDVYRSIHTNTNNTTDETILKEMEEQKVKVLQELEDLKKQCEPIDKVAKDDELRVSFFLRKAYSRFDD
jgi:translation initiation factor 3 subunit E